jgi:putative hemolysin
MVFAILIALLLILISGIFSLFDFSFNSCRKARLEQEQGKIYKAVLAARENPRKYSLVCLLWINIFRVLAAFYAGAVVIFLLTIYVKNVSFPVMTLIILAMAIVTGIITALLGDALPKLISRTKPEKICAILLPIVKFFYIPMAPLVFPAIKFSSFFQSAFNVEIADNNITEYELRHALLEGEKHGIVESSERTMVEGVFYLGDRPVGAFMTHRSEIQWLDCKAPYEEVREKALEFRSQRCFPVVNGNQDEIVGVVYFEDIILDSAQPNPQGLQAIMKQAQFVPETMSALKAFEAFKQGEANFLFVMDEYGGLAGIISITALLEEIVGELSKPVEEEEPMIQQEDGSWLADGTLSIDEAVKALSLTGLPEDGEFHTLAGFVLYLAGELPKIGDSFEYQGYKFKVVDKDGNRIDKLLINKIETEKSE